MSRCFILLSVLFISHLFGPPPFYTQASSSPLSLALLTAPCAAANVNNTSTIVREDDIACYSKRTHPGIATVSGCRPTLNLLKVFPGYKRRQVFLEGQYPRDHTPPLYIYQDGSNCAIFLSTVDHSSANLFSWEDVRYTAQAILSECEEEDARGGWAPLTAPAKGWSVVVIGWEGPGPPPLPPGPPSPPPWDPQPTGIATS